MGAIGYYLFYALNWTVTLLPMRVLYLFSDFVFLIVYYFPGYRKKVVRTNLKNSFPEKTEEEIRSIERKFYHHFSDLLIEILALTHLYKKQLVRRFTVSNMEILEKLYDEKRDVAAIVAHYNNWEWSNYIPSIFKHKLVSIYKPLENKYFDGFMNDIRLRYGVILSPMSNVIRDIINLKKNNINFVACFISDQTPAITDIKYWTTFLNQDTPVYTGAEKIASKYDMAVVFFNIQKIKRGHYNLNIELLYEHAAGLPEHLITDTHVKHLENIIREKPEYWLWTHRRWKRKRPVVNA
jgi:Kdo2-lipid IVA lauroyltransferase/acyltransferase